ncbi:MAG TPA: sugar ABC transporter ATP-binding protein [Candidatus Limnocylindrales bacterium]|nr:sugar ABC transporter ATP-binding protein [Candidatus Limnocylindrales bacterium]
MMTATETPLLSIRHASKAYGGIPALIDAALDLRAGEVHALMGENGAGKSTLIKLLSGVTPADTMEVLLRGQPVAIHEPQKAFDLGLRFIHQELAIVPDLSAAENLYLSYPYPRRWGALVDWRALNRRAADVLAELGITHIAPTALAGQLSPGDQMLVKIAAALVDDGRPASVYVMDEPTAALTGEESAQLFGVIKRLCARGCAVLYVSHRMDEVFQIAQRVTVMRDGRVVAELDIDKTTPAGIIRLMTGRDLQQVYPPRVEPVGDDVRLAVRDLASDHVRGLTFDVHAGEIVGIAGLAGAGRSEALRVLMGADRKTGGQILLDGKPVRALSVADAWAEGLGFVPEERRAQGLILSRPISDNISLPHLGHVKRGGFFLSSRMERMLAQSLAEAVRLKAVSVRQTSRELSGGNQQKVVFARALAREPRVLLLDEPTRGIDVGAKADLYALIRLMSARGAAVLMVSSDLPELLGLCDRLVILRRGAQSDVAPTAGMTESDLLSLCYGAHAS